MSEKTRQFWAKATGYQHEACTSPNEVIDLTSPGEDRWIYTTIQTVNPGTDSLSTQNQYKWLHLVEHSAYVKLESALRVAEETLNFYANHESVIKEAYHSSDERQITCVHTFINHKAIEALACIREALGGGDE